MKLKNPRPPHERWNVRQAWSGALLGHVNNNDIDQALNIARMFYGHDVTVDNLHR